MGGGGVESDLSVQLWAKTFCFDLGQSQVKAEQLDSLSPIKLYLRRLVKALVSGRGSGTKDINTSNDRGQLIYNTLRF